MSEKKSSRKSVLNGTLHDITMLYENAPNYGVSFQAVDFECSTFCCYSWSIMTQHNEAVHEAEALSPKQLHLLLCLQPQICTDVWSIY